MAKRHLLVALLAVVIGVLTATGAAFAQDVRGVEPTTEARDDGDRRDHRAFCHRLASKIHHLRATLSRLETLETRIERAIASGTLTEEQLVRARHALAKIERVEEALEAQLARALEVFEERCRD